jgi:hypothetical protein
MVNQSNEFKFIIIGEDSKSTGANDTDNVNEVIKLINDGKHVFMFIFMEDCGFCDNAKPAWKNLEKLDLDNVALVLLNQKLLEGESFSGLKDLIGKQPLGFPTFKHIHKNKVDEYSGDRDEESLKKWIHQKSKSSMRENVEKHKFSQKGYLIGGRKRTSKHGKRKMKTTRNKRGGKWSAKYKKSINCKRPKGFSQKQYCKYGRK